MSFTLLHDWDIQDSWTLSTDNFSLGQFLYQQAHFRGQSKRANIPLSIYLLRADRVNHFEKALLTEKQGACHLLMVGTGYAITMQSPSNTSHLGEVA